MTRYSEDFLTPDRIKNIRALLSRGLSATAHLEIKPEDIEVCLNRSGEIAYQTKAYYDNMGVFSVVMKSYSFYGRIILLTQAQVAGEKKLGLGFYDTEAEIFCAWTNNMAWNNNPCCGNGTEMAIKIFGSFPAKSEKYQQKNQVEVRNFTRVSEEFN